MALQKGNIAPGFILNDTSGKPVSLDDLKEKSTGDVLLIFFPLAFSSVCTAELCTMRDNMKLYDSLHTTVAGISVDSFFTLREFKKANNLNFMLLSDFHKKVSRSYEVINEDYFGMKGVSKRSAFIIDRSGQLKYAEVLEDPGKMPDFKAIQQTLLSS